jgi:hypothetical protein
MKSSLPGYLEYSKSYNRQPVAEPQQPAPERPARLGRTRAALLIFTLTLLAGLALVVFQLMWNYPVVSHYVSGAVEREIDTTTRQSSTRLVAMIDFYTESATRLAEDPGIARLFVDGDSVGLRAREAALRREFPKALNVRLLPPGLIAVDMESSPPLSYSALDQMRMAEAGIQEPPVEVHLLGTLQQHISIVRRVVDPAGRNVIGHIMMSLPNESLQNIFDDLQQVQGYIELQQTHPNDKPTVVTQQGDTSNKAGEPARIVPIPGSRWQVAYWIPLNNPVYLFAIGAPLLFAVVLVSAGLLLVVVGLLRRLVNDSLSVLD